MHLVRKGALPAGTGFSFVFLLMLGMAVGALPVCVQAVPAITNLTQLTQAIDGDNRLVADVQLEATIFACDTNSGALVLMDEHGAALLEMDGLEREFQPGEKIRIGPADCYVRSGDAGICVSPAPRLDNDGIHGARTDDGDFQLAAGRYPVRVDWFNQFAGSDLQVAGVAANSEGQANAGEMASNLMHATRAEVYEGDWIRLPNFQMLRPIKTGPVTNFDLAFRTREELVGIRFRGYFDAPRSGNYHLSLRSDDGSRLWLGDPMVPALAVGTNAAPPAPPAAIGEPMISLAERRLATLEGRVSFVSQMGKGFRLELRSEPDAAEVIIANAGTLEPKNLLNAWVRVSGVASGVLLGDGRTVLGRLVAASSKEVTVIGEGPGKADAGSVLTTMLQVHSLTAADAARDLPARIRGVVTAVGPGTGYWIAIQDDTGGGFARVNRVTNCNPNIGEYWEIAGVTSPGDFAPIIMADHATLLGQGRLPEPAHPTWNQLVNGNLDVQWVELQGVVTGVRSNRISLLLPEGRQEVAMEGWGESELKQYYEAVVRIRGTLFAIWSATTHEVRVGSVLIRNGSVSVDKAAPADPFDAPEKTPRGLFLFDAKATPFQRVKVRGRVTYADAGRVFIERSAGIQVIPSGGESAALNAGDEVEAVGYPVLSGPSPMLREALLRKVASGVLPGPPLIPDSELAQERLASARVRIDGTLVGTRLEDDVLVLQIQTRTHLFVARLGNAASLASLRLGSKLSLTGIYFMPGSDASHFELLVNAPGDITVISRPSWWTLERLLSAIGVLLVTLALAAVWITVLRHQIAQRTQQLRREIRERERAEHEHALEAERSRIARDLHDDLGASLTEINVLASTGQRPRSQEHSHPVLFKAIGDKARSLIGALDVIVWAVDPEDNSLQSLADYLSGYAREYLSNSGLACRLKIPITLPDVRLDGDTRHELLMVVKEILNNIVRHADATSVEFQMNLAGDALEIIITDDGKGFDQATEAGGHGLRNYSARLKKIGGTCKVESSADTGTTVRARLPLPMGVAARGGKADTTFG